MVNRHALLGQPSLPWWVAVVAMGGDHGVVAVGGDHGVVAMGGLPMVSLPWVGCPWCPALRRFTTVAIETKIFGFDQFLLKNSCRGSVCWLFDVLALVCFGGWYNLYFFGVYCCVCIVGGCFAEL